MSQVPWPLYHFLFGPSTLQQLLRQREPLTGHAHTVIIVSRPVAL